MVLRGDPAPLRWLIGVELARYRNAAKLSLTEASDHSGISRAKLGHLETGRQQQDPHDIARLLTTYQVDQTDIDRIISLSSRADDATWWAPWAQVVPDWLKTFVGLEGLAESEFVFEPLIIPGLLQTEQYAAALTAGQFGDTALAELHDIGCLHRTKHRVCVFGSKPRRIGRAMRVTAERDDIPRRQGPVHEMTLWQIAKTSRAFVKP